MTKIVQKGIEPTFSAFLLFLNNETDLLRKYVWYTERFMLEDQFNEWCKNYEKVVVVEDINEDYTGY